jgi:O-antigen/teichoic acid export membrane protein
LIKRLLTGSFARASALTLGLSGVTLILNLFTGLVLARALAPAGRGEVAAALVVAQLFGWFASFGARQALTYRISVEPASARALVATWLCMLPFAGGIGIALAELALPALFSAQSSEALDVARVFALTTALFCWSEMVYGGILGHQRFLQWNLLRVGQPALIAVGYVCFELTSGLTVDTALYVNAGALAIVPAIGLGSLIRSHGLGLPRVQLARESLSYGLRSHLGGLAAMLNARLDLLLMPAFLSAASVGHYAVSTNVVGVIAGITGTLSYIVLPAAARKGAQGSRTVVLSMHATFVVGLATAAGLAIAAPLLIPLLYGEAFRPSVTPMLLLLPGVVVWTPAIVLMGGLEAVNRPMTGSIPQIVAAVLTVTGLSLFLARGGINAAAAVSSIAYASAFVIAAFLYTSVTGTARRQLLPSLTLYRGFIAGRRSNRTPEPTVIDDPV